MNDEVYPAQETISYVFPGNKWTADDTLRVTWYDGGRRPTLKFPGLPKGEELPQPASIMIGEKGYLLVMHWGEPKLYPEKDFADFKWPELDEANHYHDWVDACLAGNTEISDNFAYAGPLTETVQLGNVAARFPGKKLEWDAENLRITNLEEANQWLTREYREGWSVEQRA
jgi:hypothetical protein